MRHKTIAIAVSLAAFLGIGTPAAPAAGCPNEALREGQTSTTLPHGSTYLPDCMALEMVSPPAKFNQRANAPTISADGKRVLFKSTAALAGTPGLIEPGGDHYVATRSSSGWSTQPTSPPAEMISIATLETRAYSPDFTSWLHLTATSDQQDFGIGQVFTAGLGGLHEPLSPPLQVVDLAPGENEPIASSRLQGAPADLSQLYFALGKLKASLLPGDPAPAGPEARKNTYLAQLDSNGQPSLQLLARDGLGKAWGGNCGARLGGDAVLGIGTSETNLALRSQGAIPPDGSYAYFSTRPGQPASSDCDPIANELRILKRAEGPGGPTISELIASECTRVSPACDFGDGDDFFQGASVDGTKVYFATPRQLANTDIDTPTACSEQLGASGGCDLYLYDSTLPSGNRLIQVSAGLSVPGKHEAGKGANVLTSIPAISGDGSRVYFVAQGVLTAEKNPAGKEAETGKPNLYLYQRDSDFPAGRLAFVGALGLGDGSGAGLVWGNVRRSAYAVPLTGTDQGGKETGGDGHVLLLQSQAPLTSDDTDGNRTDVFRYDAGNQTLERVSKATPGGADNGAFDAGLSPRQADIPGPSFAEEGRWVSENGETVLFKTEESLLPEDNNGATDSYLWKQGQLYRLPGTSDPTGQLRDLPRLSHDGSMVAFQTYAQLLPQDGDTTKDVYLINADGGFPNPPPPPVCNGEGCQQPFGPQPGEVGSASDGFSGTGNKPKAPRCKKGQVRKRGNCVKRPGRHRKAAHKSKSHKRDSNHDRRAAK